MANDYFNASGQPGTGSPGSSQVMRDQLANIALGFDKMAPLTGHGGELVAINAGGTAQVSTSAISVSGSVVTVNTLNVNGAVTLNNSSGVTNIGSNAPVFGQLNVQRYSPAPYATISLGDSATPANTVGMYLRQTAGEAGLSTGGAALSVYRGGPGTTRTASFGASGGLLVDAPATGISLTADALTGNRSFQAGIISTGTNKPRLEVWHTEATGTTRLDFSASTGTIAGQFSIAGVNYMTVTSAGTISIPTPAGAVHQLVIDVAFSNVPWALIVGNTTTNARNHALIGGIGFATGQQFVANSQEIYTADAQGLNIGTISGGGEYNVWTAGVVRHQISAAGNQFMYPPTSGNTLQVRNNGEVDQLVFSTWNGNPATDQFGIKHNAGVSRIGSIRSGGSLQLMYDNAVTSITINPSGTIVANAPSSGITHTVNALAGGQAYAAVAPSGTLSGYDLYISSTRFGSLWGGTSSLSLEAVGASTTLNFATNSATRVTIASSGDINVGANSGSHTLLRLAATDRAWGSGYTAAGLGTYGHWFDTNAGLTGITGNTFFDGTNWKYMTTNPVGFIDVGPLSGRMRFIVGASGTAGNTVTLTEIMGITYSTGKVNIERGAFTTTNTQSFTATPTFDANNSNVFEFSGAMTGNVTSCTINNPSNGQAISIRVKQDGTGGRTFAHPSGAKITGTISLTANCASILSLLYSMMDSRWEGSWTQLPA